jgi:hypothetical protein
MWDLYRTTMRTINGWDTHEWMMAYALLVVAGMVLLRGFGSRKSY